MAAAVIGIYFVFITKSSAVVEESLKTCSINDKHASDFIDSRPAPTSIWVYNVTNPHQFANGETPDIHELGPFGFSIDQIRINPVFSQKEGTFEYETYYDVSEENSRSCSGCSPSDKVNLAYYAYQSLLGQSKNEGVILLSLTCSPTQIGLMTTPGVPYCTALQRGNTSVNCKCCRPSPLAPPGASFCKDVVLSTSRAGGILSFLSMHDNGLKLNSRSTGFALSSGVYTSLVREVTVNEVLWGHASVLVGSLNTASGINAGSSATAAQKLLITANSNTTSDLLLACSFNTSTCPTVTSLAAGNPATWKAAVCKGAAPDVEVLVSRGISRARAEKLRYLEGVSCRPVTPSLIIAAAITKDPSPRKSFVCVDGSHQLPCCLKSFNAPSFAMKGQGLGCVQWVGGLVQTRKVFSDAEAVAYLSPTKEIIGTSCAPKNERFQIQMFKEVTSGRAWYTPPTYSYPNMTWADTTIMKPALLSPSLDHFTVTNVSGDVFGIHQGKGFKAQFLSSELTESTEPLKKTLGIWVSFRRAAVAYTYLKNIVLKGITTNHYEFDLHLTNNHTEREQQQRHGILPYQNMFSTYYSNGGRPFIMSAPNFYGSEPEVLSQRHNLPYKTNLTTGVNIYRTRAGYDSTSERIEPELITPDTWSQFGDDYIGKLSIEPATGLTVDGAVVNQMSTHTWNCNPQIEPTCSFFFYNKTASHGGKLCYHSGLSYFPCSVNNVFTPSVIGGKLLPLFWLKAEPVVSPTVFTALHTLQRKEFIASILVIVLPALAFLGIIFLVVSIVFVRRKAQQVSATVIEMKPIEQQGV